ncbi:hypothetical protein OW959_22745 [Klebsiella pneumoniae]|nr:hypothetical protein [Klebsiella pneumoniae]
MTGFDDIRPIEGMWNPNAVRGELRRVFVRWLSHFNNEPTVQSNEESVDELSILKLSQHYRLECPGSRENIASLWNTSIERIDDGGPVFDELQRLGWIRFDGCSWVMSPVPPGSYSTIDYPSQSTKTFLLGLCKPQFVPKTATTPPDVQELANTISTQLSRTSHVSVNNVDTVLGDLWKRLCPAPLIIDEGERSNNLEKDEMDEGVKHDPSEFLTAHNASVDQAFAEWSAWCSVFGGYGKWYMQWDATEKQYCREAAYRTLDRQELWGSWFNDLESYTSVLKNTFAIPNDKLAYMLNHFDMPPETLVERVDWLSSRGIEQIMMERLFMHHDGPCGVSFAYNLLCSELEKTELDSNLSSKISAFLKFALGHPMAFQKLKIQLYFEPALSVDMLMHSKTVCMMAKILIEWAANSGGYNERIKRREAQTQAFVVEDALSFIAYHMNEGHVDAKEYAALITWCYTGNVQIGHAPTDSRRYIGRQLVGLLTKLSHDTQSLVLDKMLTQSSYINNVPRACFAAVLDVLNFLPHISGHACLPIVELYSKFARDRHLEWTDAAGLDPTLAMRLVATAFAQDEPHRNALLIPFDSIKILRDTSAEDKVSIRFSVGKTLRVHIRLLARAITGWHAETVPSELYDALKLLSSRSVIDHEEKGRVGALTDRYSGNLFMAGEEGSPAFDLAGAYLKLDSQQKKDLLQIFMQCDDPVFLAELSQYLPFVERQNIHERLQQLKPDDASTTWTWAEIQHRIESLLAVDEVKLAREYYNDIEYDLNRAPSQFRLVFFGIQLQLIMKEKNWEFLDSIIVPAELKGAAEGQAKNLLEFYRATSQLQRPNGDLTSAKMGLQKLASLPNASFAYKENLFAVAIQQLFGATIQPLQGENKIAGEILLAEINAEIDAGENRVSNNLFANRALLLIGLKRPDEALNSLRKLRNDISSPDLENIAVLAKYEMGHKGEAMAMLDAALEKYGDNANLQNLKRDLASGEAILSVASATEVFDSLVPIRNALQQLCELLPSQVGDVLGPPGKGVRGYLVRQVARAVSSLQHMASILRDKKNEEDEERFEDDLNTAFREVLGASLAVAKWDVADQSLGGQTAKGNPGERDAVIRVAGQEIAIYEALVCSGLNKTTIKSHFDKLIGYGVCDVYFHVIYSYTNAIKPLLDYVKEMFEGDAPSNLTYISSESLMPPDYEISGYMARYLVDHREIAVIFMVADLKVRIPDI